MILNLLLALASAASAAPRLLVVVSVDQMRAAYLSPSSGTYSAGLARLQREGFVFADARHLHVPTETAPGHAVILTGRAPASHGIVGNAWYDAVRGRSSYCVEDSVHGRGPEHLQGYTLGDVLKARDRESRVVSVAGKDRAAILLGGWKADAALWYSGKSGEFVTSTYYERPGWLDKFNRGLRDEGQPLHGATTAYLSAVVRTPEYDRMVLRLALEAARRFKLGRDEHPDVLAVGFSATDYIGHRHGSESAQMAEQLARLDGALGELLEGLEDLVGRGELVLALTADHGAPPDSRALKKLPWSGMPALVERALQFDYPVQGSWVLGVEFPNVYLSREKARAAGLEWRQFLRQAARRLSTLDGIESAFVSDELDPSAPDAAAYERSRFPGRTGDVILRPRRGVVVGDDEDAQEHGSPYEYDASVPLVFWGAGVASGRSTGTVRVADLAPTAASLLGFEFKPEPESRVLPVSK
jgi:predicted AlkP superfamily pyrophosphatase or phosphodiesterase